MGCQYEIWYRKSGDHANCDALSRLPSEDSTEATESAIYTVQYQLPVLAKDIAEETRTDKILSKVFELTLNGWPDKCNDQELLPYAHKKDQLSVEQGCILWGSRVIIPPRYRMHLLAELHEEHPGIVRMKS